MTPLSKEWRLLRASRRGDDVPRGRFDVFGAAPGFRGRFDVFGAAPGFDGFSANLAALTTISSSQYESMRSRRGQAPTNSRRNKSPFGKFLHSLLLSMLTSPSTSDFLASQLVGAARFPPARPQGPRAGGLAAPDS